MSNVELPSQLLAVLDDILNNAEIARYIMVACTVTLTWENLISFQREVELIWKANSSVGKWLYFAIRYPIILEYYMITASYFVLNPSESLCLGATKVDLWCTWLFVIPVQIMIALRILALWDRRKIVMGILVASIIGTDAVLIMSVIRWSDSITFEKSSPLAPIIGCAGSLIVGNVTTTYPASAAYMAFDTVIFALTLVRALPYLRNCRAELLTVLIRDGFVYYSIMLASTSINLFLVLFAQSQLGLITGMRQVIRMLMNILVARVILNARGTMHRHTRAFRNETDRTTSMQEGGVSFSEPISTTTGTNTNENSTTAYTVTTTTYTVDSIGGAEWFALPTRAEGRTVSMGESIDENSRDVISVSISEEKTLRGEAV